MKKTVWLLAALAIALVGCKPEQSQLSLDSIKDTAVVSGHVVYSIGQESDGTNYATEVLRPAAGKKVFVDVPYSSYSTGAKEGATKTFQTVVDTAGDFSLAIPVPTVGLAGAKLRFEEFTAQQSIYQRMENGEPVFETRMCKFEVHDAPALPTTLKPEPFIVPDVCYERTVIDMQDYKESAVLTGSLLLPYETGFHTGAYKAAAECQFEITIIDGQDFEDAIKANEVPQEFTYGTTADANGVFSINLPLKDLKKGFKVVDAIVIPKAESKFVHYTNVDGASVQVAGAYELREIVSLRSVNMVISGVECNIGERPLKFIPGYNNGIVESTQKPVNWDDNLAGWVFAEEEFREMQETATLKGSVALAAETGFGVGTYVTSPQTVKLTGTNSPYNKTFTVLTKADGTFELPIPVAEAGTNPAGQWTVELDPGVISYTHYASATKEVVLKEGSYNLYATVRANDAEWNELGARYYKFENPSVQTLNEDLAGWVVKEEEGYDETVTVKARFFFPVEESYCVGKYQGASLRAEVIVDGTPYVGPIAADGTFSVPVLVKNANSVLNVGEDAFRLIDAQTDEFKHYAAISSNAQLLEGRYASVESREAKDGTWNDKYTFYYRFVPSVAPSDWTYDLAGWLLYPENYEPTTWTANVQMPIETGFWEGSYEGLDKGKVQLSYTIGNTTYQPVVLTDADGNISCDIYLPFGLGEPTVRLVKVFADELEHYYNPASATATTVLEGSYGLRLTDPNPNVVAWNAKRTYYMQFTPGANVDRDLLSWPIDLVGWQKVRDRKTNARVMLYAQKAVEKKDAALNAYVAGWNPAGSVKATVTIHNYNNSYSDFTFNCMVAGQNLFFMLPLSYVVEQTASTLIVSVTLEDETSNITAFQHWEDPTGSSAAQMLYGNYRSIGNISRKTAIAINATEFELKESAKMFFYYYDNGWKTPDGYTWNETAGIE